MARNGSGTYSLVSGNPVVTGSVISSTTMNNTLSDIATALTGSLASDGQTTPTANIPMGGYKITGLGAATAAGNAVRYEQLTNSAGSTITSFLQAGTSAVATTVQAKLREFVSVFDFMTTAQIADVQAGTLLLDVTAAIQAALTASLRVYIPAGTYLITSTLTLRNNQHIIGSSTLGSVLQANTDITVMSATNNSQITLEDFEIFGVGSGSSTKYGLQWTNTPYCVFNRIYVYGFARGVYFKSGGTAPSSSFSCSLNNCVVQANVDNIYCESNVNNLNLYSCRLGSATKGLYFADSNTLMVIGCDFEVCTTCAIQIDSATTALEIGATIAGNHFEACTSTTGDINIGSSFEMRGISITGNLFNGGAANVAPVKLFKASGVTFAGNTVAGTYTSAPPVLVTTSNVCISGNYPIATILNINTGGYSFPATQVTSSDVNTLDDYEEGTWTPAITFGGGSTGITYSSQTGSYTKIGNRVMISAYIALTNKGSSTGAALITALPFTTSATDTGYSAVSLRVVNVSFADVPMAYTNVSATTIALVECTKAGVETTLQDTDFSNTSGLIISCTYKV